MTHVGCCGWPVGRAEYFRRLSAIEINSTFYNLPRLSTAQRWREEAPKDFVFSVKAWQLITHSSSSPTYRRLTQRLAERSLARCGNFRASEEVASAWERTQAVARALEARFILFQTPRQFYPSPDHLRDFYRFIRELDRGGMVLVWEPRGEAWTGRLIGKVCKDLRLVHGVDPIFERQEAGELGYFRLHGSRDQGRIVYRHQYPDAELRRIADCGAGRRCFVFFNNSEMWKDACRFQEMAAYPHQAASIRAESGRMARSRL